MKRLNDDHFQFSTGQEFYANRGLIGLAQDFRTGEWEVSEGYDGFVSQAVGTFEKTEWSQTPFSAQERVELADYMIALWTAYKLTAFKAHMLKGDTQT